MSWNETWRSDSTCNVMVFDAIWCHVIWCNIMQLIAKHCKESQRNTVTGIIGFQCNVIYIRCNVKWHEVMRLDARQLTFLAVLTSHQTPSAKDLSGIRDSSGAALLPPPQPSLKISVFLFDWQALRLSLDVVVARQWRSAAKQRSSIYEQMSCWTLMHCSKGGARRMVAGGYNPRWGVLTPLSVKKSSLWPFVAKCRLLWTIYLAPCWGN